MGRGRGGAYNVLIFVMTCVHVSVGAQAQGAQSGLIVVK